MVVQTYQDWNPRPGRNDDAEAVPSGPSRAQIRANRRNAKRSTGPRTAEGKQRSSRNAITHGTFCRDLLLPGEDEAELLSLQRGIYTSLSPQDEMERELVDRVVAAQWRLRRARGAEWAALLSAAASPEARPSPTQRQIQAGLAVAERVGLMDVLRATDLAEAIKGPEREDPPLPPLARTLCGAANSPVERLSVYEQRLEQSVHRAIRELRLLRKDKREQAELPPCPYLEEEDEPEADPAGSAEAPGDEQPRAEVSRNVAPDANAQNEPNSPLTPASTVASTTSGSFDATMSAVPIRPLPVPLPRGVGQSGRDA